MLDLELQQLEYETHRNLTKKIKALSDEPIRYALLGPATAIRLGRPGFLSIVAFFLFYIF